MAATHRTPSVMALEPLAKYPSGEESPRRVAIGARTSIDAVAHWNWTQT